MRIHNQNDVGVFFSPKNKKICFAVSRNNTFISANKCFCTHFFHISLISIDKSSAMGLPNHDFDEYVTYRECFLFLKLNELTSPLPP